MRILYCGVCDKGAVRTMNQDSVLMFYNEAQEMGLFVVADGMGGHSGGEIASKMITQCLGNWAKEFEVVRFSHNFSEMMKSLLHQLEYINEKIYREHGTKEICGSTCSLVMIYRENYGIIHVGDSRIYQFSGWTMEQLTRDDVWEMQSDIRKEFSESEIEHHPDRGKLLKAVGAKERILATVRTDLLKKNDILLICSDGLYKYCPLKSIKKAVRGLTEKNLEERVKLLLEKTYEAGAKDNISVIAIKVSEKIRYQR